MSRSGRVPVFCVLLFWIGIYAPLPGQDRPDQYFPTPNTAKDARPDPKKAKPKVPRTRFIITNDARKTLAGNACFEEVTQNMGFMYLAVPPGQGPNRNGWTRNTHNLGVKTAILFKNGPFWKLKVNKWREECRKRSGDYVG
jgi:hypothetical protein